MIAAETTSVRLTYGIHDLDVEVDGLAVVEVAIAYQDVLNLPTNCEAYVNGLASDGNTIVGAGDRVEFIKIRGRKFFSKREFMFLTCISEKQWTGLLASGLQTISINEGENITEAEFRKWTQSMNCNADTIERAALRKKPGRKNTTMDIAVFADTRMPGMRWKEIFAEWREQNPGDKRVRKWQHIYDAWRRAFKGKK